MAEGRRTRSTSHELKAAALEGRIELRLELFERSTSWAKMVPRGLGGLATPCINSTSEIMDYPTARLAERRSPTAHASRRATSLLDGSAPPGAISSTPYPEIV